MKKYVKQTVGVCIAMLMAVSAGEYSGTLVQAAENQETVEETAPVYEAGNVAQKKTELFITGSMTVPTLRAALH